MEGSGSVGSGRESAFQGVKVPSTGSERQNPDISSESSKSLNVSLSGGTNAHAATQNTCTHFRQSRCTEMHSLVCIHVHICKICTHIQTSIHGLIPRADVQRWVPSKHMAIARVEVSGTYSYMV